MDKTQKRRWFSVSLTAMFIWLFVAMAANRVLAANLFGPVPVEPLNLATDPPSPYASNCLLAARFFCAGVIVICVILRRGKIAPESWVAAGRTWGLKLGHFLRGDTEGMGDYPYGQVQSATHRIVGLMLFVFAAALGICAVLAMADLVGCATGWIVHVDGKGNPSQPGFDARFFDALTASALVGFVAAILAIVGCVLRPPTAS